MKIAKDSTTFEEHLDKRYGKTGTSERNEFERNVKAFIIGELIREARLSAKLTQEQLAQKSGTKKKLHFAYRERTKRYSVNNLVQNY